MSASQRATCMYAPRHVAVVSDRDVNLSTAWMRSAKGRERGTQLFGTLSPSKGPSAGLGTLPTRGGVGSMCTCGHDGSSTYFQPTSTEALFHFISPDYTGRTLHALWAVSSASCCTYCFFVVSSPDHTPMGVGTLSLGTVTGASCAQNPSRLTGTNSKTDSALTSNCILCPSHDAGTRGCMYHQHAHSALMTASLRYARRREVLGTSDAIQPVTESLWR